MIRDPRWWRAMRLLAFCLIMLFSTLTTGVEWPDSLCVAGILLAGVLHGYAWAMGAIVKQGGLQP
jgi:hypothetical protein